MLFIVIANRMSFEQLPPPLQELFMDELRAKIEQSVDKDGTRPGGVLTCFFLSWLLCATTP